MHEASLHDESTFVTLTYAPKHLPPGGTLVLRDWQLFAKRLRADANKKIPHFMCGEYGETNGRPHYHACLFGLELDDQVLDKVVHGNSLYTSQHLDNLWGKGITRAGAVTFESAAYVARYIMKKVNGELAEAHYEHVDTQTGEITKRKPEFTTMSRRPGLGKGWFDKWKDDVFPLDEVITNGKTTRVPRYYDGQYELTHPDEMEAIKLKREQNCEHLVEDTPLRLKQRLEFLQRKTDRYKRDVK